MTVVGQAFAADGSRVAQGRGVERAHDGCGFAERVFHGCEQFGAGGFRGSALRFEGGQLRAGQVAALQVGHETLSAARNVAQVEANGSEAEGASPQLLLREGGGVPGQVFAGHLERVEQGR